jgi:hypothetical protein
MTLALQGAYSGEVKHLFLRKVNAFLPLSIGLVMTLDRHSSIVLVGTAYHVKAACKQFGQQWAHGIRACRTAFPT